MPVEAYMSPEALGVVAKRVNDLGHCTSVSPQQVMEVLKAVLWLRSRANALIEVTGINK